MTEAAQDTAPALAIYAGHVMHRRDGPQRHRFRLPVFSLLLDIDRLQEAGRHLRLFGYNRFAPIAFADRDHGPRDGSPLRPWLEAELARHGLSDFAARLQLLCFPRLFGYVFNPLSIYFCHDRAGRLGAILYEVKNTFGGQHVYAVPLADGNRDRDRAWDRDRGRAHCHSRQKAFHVSPFLGSAGRYRFRLQPPGDRFALSIRFDDDEGNRLTAVHAAVRRPCSDRALARLLLTYPLQSLRVIGGIHWEALKLWRKGARYRSPPAPANRVPQADIPQ